MGSNTKTQPKRTRTTEYPFDSAPIGHLSNVRVSVLAWDTTDKLPLVVAEANRGGLLPLNCPHAGPEVFQTAVLS